MASVMVCATALFAQGNSEGSRRYFNPAQVGAFSTSIAPDARATGMGDIGVATTADAYSVYHNVSKLPFISGSWGLSGAYTPWLTELADDMGITYLTGYYTWGGTVRHAVTGSFRYFNIGEAFIIPKSISDAPVEIRPFELSADIGYAIKLNPKWGVGAAVRYVRSDMNAKINGVDNVAQTVMLDLSASYVDSVRLFGYDLALRTGIAINNIGGKLSYDGGVSSSFSPTIVRLGAGLSHSWDGTHEFSWHFEADKILAPSVPLPDSPDFQSRRKELNEMGAIEGLFHSLSDAPRGMSEELEEISWATGAEYGYEDMFFARVGCRYQNPAKGNNSGIFLGLGLKYSKVNFDISYFTGFNNLNPLNNTLRLSVGVTF